MPGTVLLQAIWRGMFICLVVGDAKHKDDQRSKEIQHRWEEKKKADVAKILPEAGVLTALKEVILWFCVMCVLLFLFLVFFLHLSLCNVCGSFCLLFLSKEQKGAISPCFPFEIGSDCIGFLQVCVSFVAEDRRPQTGQTKSFWKLRGEFFGILWRQIRFRFAFENDDGAPFGQSEKKQRFGTV